MRQKFHSQQPLFDNFEALYPAVTFMTDEELKGISHILDSIPEILDLIAEDLRTVIKSRSGRGAVTIEQVLRSAILRQRKHYSYRELADRIADSINYRHFTRFMGQPIPHFTTFEKLINAIRPETWKKINDLLVDYASRTRKSGGGKIENGKALRLDTTVIETNIAYPVDARLLLDSVRVLTRMLRFCRLDLGITSFFFSSRMRRVKKRSYQIVLLKGPNAQKKRRKLYRDLLKATAEVINMAEEALPKLHKALSQDIQNKDIQGVVSGFEHFLPLVHKAVDQCRRRVLDGEKVPAEEKIVSIFEEHTDIICRGKSGSPVEFGHKTLFCTGKSGLITQYDVFRGNPGDNTMLEKALEIHKKQFGHAPDKLAGDRRFFSADNEEMAETEGVKYVCLPKPGRLSADRKQWQKTRWFKALQRFRAGIEGNISTLLRSFGLKRCFWKGWEAFKSYVGLGSVTYNLRKIVVLAA